jgi:uncharacterized protein (TIGR03067 family)
MGSSATDVEQLLQTARFHLAKRELQEAVEQATEVIRQDSKQTAAYLVRAEAHRRLKRPERALADLAVAIRLDPNQASPYVIRAEILKRRNVFGQAIADATHALTLDPRNAAAFAIRAECRSAIGDMEGATEDVQEMVHIDPTRSVPDLRGKSESEDSSPAMTSNNQRFRKQSGADDPKRQSDIFADGKPVDRSLRARKPVGRDAAEVLAEGSDYRPEVLPSPLPRRRARQYASIRSPWLAVVLIAVGLAFAAGVVIATRNFAPIPDAMAVAVRSSDSDVTSSTAVIAEPKRSSVAAAETPPSRPQQSPTKQTVIPQPPIADAVPSILPRAASPCPPDDAVAFNGHSYKFFPEVLPWHRAKARCEEMGGHLAIIGSRDENDFVANVARREISRLGPKDGLWLGATDEHKEGAWEWVDGSQLFFTHWAPTQPNSKQNQEHYLLLMLLHENLWADQPNESTQHVAYFVCEWDSGSSESVASVPPAVGSDVLQGEWVMVNEEINGVTDFVTQEHRIIITGDDCVMSGTPDGRHPTYVGKIKIKETAREFDFDGKGPFGTTQVFKGIYELDGDKLRICYIYIEGESLERPTRLRSYQLPNTTMVSLLLKRSSKTETSRVPKQKTITLIRSDTLDGWHPQPWADKPQWNVKKGVLRRLGHGPSLVTNEKFKDFDLHVEFSLPPKCNSGVYLRDRYEVQLLDSAWRLPNGKPERPEGQCGSIYGLIAPSRMSYRGANQWNALDVRLVGQIVTVRMNNEILIDKKYIASVTPGGSDTDESSPGPILLQAHSGIGAEFRNITITSIP